MKQLILVIILMAVTCQASVVDTNLVVVETVGAVPVDVKDRLLAWVSTIIAPATDSGAIAVKENELVAIATAVSEMRTNREQLVLLLAGNCPATDKSLFFINGVAAVNLNALKLNDMSTSAAREIYARRLEKESVNGLARMLYMPPCPFPQCALYEYTSVDELDKKARGLCPPCSEKLQEMITKYPSRKPPKLTITHPKDGERGIWVP